MLTNEQVCSQIRELYPDFGDCNDTLTVAWDRANDAWAVDFEMEGRKIRHYLDLKDAEACVLNQKCVGMGIEFGQFR